MTEIKFQRPAKIADFPMFLERIVPKYGEVKLTFGDEASNPDDFPELTLTPLSELSTDRKKIKIISVTERFAPFDRLLVGPDHTKKSLPELTRCLKPHAIDRRSLLQWNSISSESETGEIIVDHQGLTAISEINSEGVILPWWIDPAIFLEAGWRSHELHPAEFTPAAGSGCWAITTDASGDLPRFELLKSLHHAASVVFTNAERKFKRDFQFTGLELLGNFIDRPVEDKYHLYICVRRESDDSIHYVDYPCSALGDLFEQVKSELESIVE